MSRTAMAPLYAPQYAFTTGEVSPDVANRYDLEQLKSAVLEATNVIIKPYGGISKRPGSQYCGSAGQDKGKHVILKEFNTGSGSSFLLEIYERTIRIWRNGAFTGITILTEYEDEIIPSLSFTQSADTLFICSGKYPVQILKRCTDTDWDLQNYGITEHPFEAINTDNDWKLTLNDTTLTSTKDLFTPELKGAIVKLSHQIGATYINSTGQVYTHKKPGIGGSTTTIVESFTSATGNFSTDKDIEWKFITHGSWTGTVRLRVSYDGGGTWKDYRAYSSKKDYNVSDSGVLDSSGQLQISSEISSGEVNVSLTILPYEHIGYVEIVDYVNPKQVTVKQLSSFPDGSATVNWYLGTWNAVNGFPKVCTFFQDRLVLGNTALYPNKLWFSRTGDYPNFGVEKASGTVTDDSAITAQIISRERFNLRHLVPSNNLILLTDGNEWIIDGSKTITPANLTPQVQSSHGVSKAPPVYVGTRCVYVQDNGAAVRDMGYSYESDSYEGQDLTILAKHLIKGYTIVDTAYIEAPNSTVYFLRNDGSILCLSYIPEQKVYSWSRWTTQGTYIAIEAVKEGTDYILYAVVDRKQHRQLERFVFNADKYVDAWEVKDAGSHELSGTIGYEVEIVNSSYLRYPNAHNDGSDIYIEEDNCTVGIAVESLIKLANVDMTLNDGTMQTRKSRISACVLRLNSSLGGAVGKSVSCLEPLNFLGQQLFTGDKRLLLPREEWTYMPDTSVVIQHGEPYPFNLQMVVREVEFGGGTSASYI